MFTNSEKDEYAMANINPRLNFRHHPSRLEPATTLFYVVCMHGSVATTALHYCAAQENVTVEVPGRPSLSVLIKPAFPPHFKFRSLDTDSTDIKSEFLDHYDLQKFENLTVDLNKLHDMHIVPEGMEEFYNRIAQCKKENVIQIYTTLKREKSTNLNSFMENFVACFCKYNLYAEEYAVMKSEIHYKIYEDAFFPIIYLENSNDTIIKYLVCTRVKKFETSDILDILHDFDCGPYRMFSKRPKCFALRILKILTLPQPLQKVLFPTQKLITTI